MTTITVVWRDWFSENVVETLTRMRTLPRETDEVVVLPSDDGEDIARGIAEICNEEDVERFCKGGKIVILEPPEYAGTYDVYVDYEPRFYARKIDVD